MDYFEDKKWRCLINNIKLSDDYDRKEISIDYASEINEGSVFYWDRTHSYWLVSLRQYTEEAYFRAQIDRCDYQLMIDDIPYWIYLRGPVETDIIWDQKHKLSFNELNNTLKIKITKDEKTVNFFERFKKLSLIIIIGK